ncbi:MAG: hypothetical protein HXY40_05445 [Chloroflexi bacterium]|nr:hypothetical protein [Chloroflexota bacterium]
MRSFLTPPSPQARLALHVWALAAFLLLLAALGARGLNADAIWTDEWWSLYHAGGAHWGPVSLLETWQRIATQDPWNAPGYYTLLKGWGMLVGWTAFADRAFSLLCGLLAAALAYRTGRALGGARLVGYGAAFFLGASAFFIYYLHELRAYTLYALLVTLTLWLYWRVMYGGGGWRTQTAFFASVAAMLYVHYFAALLAAALGLYHLLFVSLRRDMPAKTRWLPLALMIGGGLMFVPWAGVLLDGLGKSSNAAVRQEPLSEAVTMIATLLYAFSSAAVALALVLFAAALWALWRARPDGRLFIRLRFAWFVALSALALALALNAYMSVNAHARHFMVLLPPCALLAGFGLHTLARWRFAPPLLLGLMLVFGVGNSFTDFNDTLFGDENMRFFRIHLPWNTLADALRENTQPGDVVVFSVPQNSQGVSGPFEYYMRDLRVPGAIMEWWVREGAPAGEFAAAAANYTRAALRLWLGRETAVAAPGEWLTAFEQVITPRFSACGTALEVDGLRADLYARAPQCCHAPADAAASTLYAYGEGLALTFARGERSGSEYELLLAWLGGNSLPAYQYSVALHVTRVGETGAPLAQADYGVPLERFACHAAAISLAGLAAGSYDVRVIVYDWQTGARLPTAAGDSGVVDTITVGG